METISKKTFESMIDFINSKLNIGRGKRVVGVFDDNGSDELKGFAVVDIKNPQIKEVLSIEELFKRYER